VCGSGTSLNGATGQCEIDCASDLDDRRMEEAQQGAPETAVEAIGFLANNPAYLAKLRNLKMDEEATDSTTDLMKQLLSLFGRPALAQDERASA